MKSLIESKGEIKTRNFYFRSLDSFFCNSNCLHLRLKCAASTNFDRVVSLLMTDEIFTIFCAEKMNEIEIKMHTSVDKHDFVFYLSTETRLSNFRNTFIGNYI